LAPSENITNDGHTPDELWLGYDLIAPFEQISAVLAYQPAWDRRIVQAYGHVPNGIQAIVMLNDGRLLPSRRSLADLHRRWTAWQQQLPIAAEASDAELDQQPDDTL
jgi:hypothetical protein